jgi:translation initiation factor 3 subunit C
MHSIIRTIKNHRKIKDMSSLLNSFEDLTRAYLKALPIMAKEDSTVKPKFFLKCLVEIEDSVNEAWEDRKNMGKLNQKSLSTLRQKIRKYNRDFEEDLNALRADADGMAADDDLDVGAGAGGQDSDGSDVDDFNATSDTPSKASFLKDSSSKDEVAANL